MQQANNFTEGGLDRCNRDWIEIIGMILEICENEALKTHIMYRCNLNSKQIANYIQFLEDHKLLVRQMEWPHSKAIIYKTTEKGKKYLEAYKQLEEILK
jgi:predicted transcriptional regulator